MSFLTTADLATLQKVDTRLSAAIQAAAVLFSRQKLYVFRITSGPRTPEAQQMLVSRGLSKTQNSHHLKGLAVDLAILNRQRTVAFWDLPRYHNLNTVVQKGAEAVGLLPGELLWGGDWVRLRDGVHWQLMLPKLPD